MCSDFSFFNEAFILKIVVGCLNPNYISLMRSAKDALEQRYLITSNSHGIKWQTLPVSEAGFFASLGHPYWAF